MSKPKIKVVEESDGFIVYDTTGKYSSSNTNGHGGPNLNIGDYTKATAFAVSPSGQSYSVNMTGDMPRIDDIGYLIRPELIDGKMEPGVWTFWLELVGNDLKTYKSGTYKTLAIHVAKCCVDKMKNQINMQLLKGDEKQRKISLLHISLLGACWAANCQRWNEADSIVKTVYKNCKCDCCF